MRAASRSELGAAITWLAATIPFLPGIREFVARGVPDLLLTGDGAVLELGTIRAVHGLQLVGPYSRFGWSHPGPAYFYLAAPFYVALHRRGPALNVFAFVIDYVCAAALALIAFRLRGVVFGVAVASLVAVYVLIGEPFLLANEWNPILPILPFALTSLLAAAILLGRPALLPVFAFLGSAVIQTHVGFAPEVVALSILVGASLSRREGGSLPRGVAIATAAVVACCWILPVYEEIVHRPGNIELILRFFVPKHWAEHSWGESFRSVATQLRVMPDAMLHALRFGGRWAEPAAWVLTVAGLLGLVLLAVRRDRYSLAGTIARVTLLELAVAVLAARAIRGDVEFYLVAWMSVMSLLGALSLAAWASSFAATAYCAVLLLALAVTAGVPRSEIIPQADTHAETLARGIEIYAHGAAMDRPTIYISSPGAWPVAAATILDLTKHGIAVSVERDWVHVVGESFAEPPGHHSSLVFAEGVPDETGTQPGQPTLVAHEGNVFVFRRD